MNLKTILFPAILLGCLSLLAQAPKKKPTPPIQVISSVKDATLGDSSVFRFQFKNKEFKEYNQGNQLLISGTYNGYSHNFNLGTSDNYELKVAPGKYAFELYADNRFYEINSDSIKIKPGYRTTIAVLFKHSEYRDIPAKKPVIYLYPETDLPVKVTLKPAGELTFTYPTYQNGWSGTAHPDGSITIEGKTVPYLFWEGKIAVIEGSENQASGFIVSRQQVIPFLEEKLAAIGLTTKEQTDFITYWGPQLSETNRVFVRFIWNESCDAIAELSVTPTPDHLNRLYMIWSPIEKTAFPKIIHDQQLPVFDRSGFDVLEWGGSKIETLDF